MTAQIPDSLTVDGRRWVIDEWIGDRDCVPPDESLGFRTVSPATSNWSGRIDQGAGRRSPITAVPVD